MMSIDNKELFEKYYQGEYDYNTKTLSNEDIYRIKEIARRERVDYASSPLGTSVFDLIQSKSDDIRFELVSFASDKIDGMLYIPATGKERAYIILNSNKPLVNQIFTAAHEFYHYIEDYQAFKEKPYICDFRMLKDVNEKKASRFAAELLFPEESLKREILYYCRNILKPDYKSLNFNQMASFIILMTIKYQMPLKAVIFRLEEEGYIENIEEYLENYEFIKKVIQELEILKKSVSDLYGTENNYIISYNKIYQDMEKVFLCGNATKNEIVEDAGKLSLDMKIIKELINHNNAGDEEVDDDDEELLDIINAKRR